MSIKLWQISKESFKDCFKKCWATHKSVHKVQEEITSLFNPWPNYKFTGSLRPATLSKPRTVPESIPRPDYALDSDGISYEEKSAKRSNEVKVILFFFLNAFI